MLQVGGARLATAVALGALVGPEQVAGRLLEFSLLRRLHPLLSPRLAAAGHLLGVAAMMAAGAPGAASFVLRHGAGKGITKIAKGTLPLALFSPRGHGELQGWLLVPTRLAATAGRRQPAGGVDHRPTCRVARPRLGCARRRGISVADGVPRPRIRAL